VSIVGNGYEDHLLTLAILGAWGKSLNLYFSFHKRAYPAKSHSYPCLTLSYALFSEDIAHFQPQDTTSHLDDISVYVIHNPLLRSVHITTI